MERVTGIGGIFFRARDHEALAAWYAEHLGIELHGEFSGTTFFAERGDQTVWTAMARDTDYLGPGRPPLMINYRVRDLDAMLAQLRAAGVPVVDEVEEMEYGRFGWATDPEGNRFELWEPAKSSPQD